MKYLKALGNVYYLPDIVLEKSEATTKEKDAWSASLPKRWMRQTFSVRRQDFNLQQRWCFAQLAGWKRSSKKKTFPFQCFHVVLVWGCDWEHVVIRNKAEVVGEVTKLRPAGFPQLSALPLKRMVNQNTLLHCSPKIIDINTVITKKIAYVKIPELSPCLT